MSRGETAHRAYWTARGLTPEQIAEQFSCGCSAGAWDAVADAVTAETHPALDALRAEVAKWKSAAEAALAMVARREQEAGTLRRLACEILAAIDPRTDADGKVWLHAGIDRADYDRWTEAAK